MDKDIKPNKIKFLAIFAVTTIIFLVGIFLGSVLSDMKVDKLNKLQDDFRTDTLAVDLAYEILSDNPCSSIDSSFLTEELHELSSKLEFLQNARGIDDPKVKELRNYYSLLQLRHWMVSTQYKKYCNSSFTTIIYFFSDKKECPECDTQSTVLTHAREKHDNLRIYSFKYETDNAALKALKDLYSIKSDEVLPILIIDSNVYYGLKDSDELSKLILENNNNTMNETLDFGKNRILPEMNESK